MDVDGLIESFYTEGSDFLGESSSDSQFNITYYTDEFKKDTEDLSKDDDLSTEIKTEDVKEDIYLQKEDNSAITLDNSFNDIVENDSSSVSGFDYIIFIGLIVLLILFIVRKKRGS